MTAIKKVICILLLAPAFFTLLYAENVPLPKIHLAVTEEELAIAETGKVVEIACGEIKPAPAGEAAALAVPGMEYVWTPSPSFSRAAGGADIYSFHCTSDGSAVVILERIGGAGNNGLRIITVDVRSGKIIRAGKTIELKVLKSRLMSSGRLLVAATDPGNDGTQYFLAVIDIAGNRVIRQSGYFTGKASDMVHAGNLVAVLDGNSGEISFFSAGKLKLTGKRNPEFSGPSSIAVSPDGRTLAVSGKENLETYEFRVNNNTVYRTGQHKYDNADFSKAMFAGNDQLLLYSPDKTAYLFAGNNIVPLDVRCGRIAAFYAKKNMLFVENRMRELEVFQLPARTPVNKYTPLKMRPAARNDMEALFFIPGKVPSAIMADHRGNLWKIEFTGRRGKKIPVLIVDDTGIRKKR